MALWAKVQQLPPDSLSQVQSAYSTYFPIEVRHYFAAWIEEQPWYVLQDFCVSVNMEMKSSD